ncbi:MAG: hypothetical protein V4736_00700 [Bdellovibrionota bacterium]
MDLRKAVDRINKNGVLLVYPINNKSEPNSLWQELHPRKKMRWEWDSGGDQSVSDLWFMRERLSISGKVVYAKWYQGRATFFSVELFTAILRVFQEEGFYQQGLKRTARDVLEVLEENSPLSTKQLKKATELTGKENESLYTRSLKELWNRFIIVAYGEVDEGAFPSLAVGATRVIFEDIWAKSAELDLKKAKATIDKYMPADSLFRKYFDKTVKAMQKQHVFEEPDLEL